MSTGSGVERVCPECGEIWDDQALVNEAELRDSTWLLVLDDFEVRGCLALGLPHFRYRDLT